MEYTKIRNRLQKAKNDPCKLIEELLSLEKEISYKNIEFYNEISNFINNEQIDIYDAAIIVISKGKNVFIVANLLSRMANNIKIINPKIFVNFLILFYEKSINDYASNMFYEPIKKLAENINNGLENVEIEIIEQREQRLYGYLNIIYIGFATRDLTIGYKRLMSMVQSGDQYLISYGLRGLGSLPNIPEELFLEIKKICLKFCDSEDTNIASSAVFTLYKLIEYEQDIKEKILFLSEKKVPEIQLEIIRLLSTKEDIDQTDLEIIFNICQYDLKLGEISNYIDSICYKLVKKEDIPNLLKILNNWIYFHSIEVIKKANITTIFNLSIHEMFQNNELMKKLTTNWLNSDDSRYHYALTSIFESLSTYTHKSIELDSNILNTLQFNDILYIVKKILGYIDDYYIAIKLITSILKVKKITPDIEKITSEVLVEVYGDRAPLKTKIILENLLKSKCAYSRKARSIINTCFKQITDKIETLESLGKLNELQPNIDQQIKLSQAFQKLIHKASDDALRSSPLMSIMERRSIKAGNGCFFYNNGEYSQIIPMYQHSHTLEFPQEMMLDEIGYYLEKYACQRAKRNES
ncbi:Uncharacterised protein [Legionella busanensis]|uniref:Uncharacterized protein n=1 Tax=Legionella busanensis TaxID=190655 RepID=A0A378JL27_9GAMM|nr:hypothetical protein [Legionella busanensis]STX50919.1 Uncharacterised protein [Legionella busanensis]